MLPYIGCVAAIIVLIIQQYAQAKRLDELTAPNETKYLTVFR